MRRTTVNGIVLAYNTSWYVWMFRMPLIQALKDRGYRVIVLAPRDEYTERIVACGVEFLPIRLSAKGRNPVQEIMTAAAFFRAYRRLRPAVVLHYTIKPNLYGSLAARALGIPAIDNVTGLGALFDRRSGLRAVVSLLYKVAFRRVERVFFQNPDDFAAFVDGGLVASGRAGLLPGSGVNLQRFAPRPRGAGPFTFLFVGRLLKAKGVEDLIAASRLLARRMNGFRVVLLGKQDDDDPGAADPRILAGASAQGVVELAGSVDDVRPFIAEAACVVLPSYYREGTPRTLLEAAAMGRPLIAADSVGTREPVRDGVNGYLCRPRDPEDLAAKMFGMATLSEQALSAMGMASRRIAEERFDERIVIVKYIEIIDRLVGKASQ
jgi:glycosyltransferase involved in cell wall biosynthesis